MILEAAVFLFVPPAPSSTIKRSASAIAAPISFAPSISRLVREKEPPEEPT